MANISVVLLYSTVLKFVGTKEKDCYSLLLRRPHIWRKNEALVIKLWEFFATTDRTYLIVFLPRFLAIC